MWPPCAGLWAAARGPRSCRGQLTSPRSGDRGEGVLHELLELGGEPLAGGDVEAGDGVGGVGVAVAVGVGAVRVAMRVAVRVGGSGVIAGGFAWWLDPDVAIQVGERGIGAGLRERAKAGAVLVAPVAAERPLVDLGLADEGVEVGRGAWAGGPVGAAPAVAG